MTGQHFVKVSGYLVSVFLSRSFVTCWKWKRYIGDVKYCDETSNNRVLLDLEKKLLVQIGFDSC